MDHILNYSAKDAMRIFIFDACFGRMTGHWENYCQRFYQELVSQGHEVVVYGQKNPIEKIIHGVNFKPLFQHFPFVEMREIADFDRQAKLFLHDLKSVKAENFQDNDLLIFHSIFPQILGAILPWTESLVQQKSVKIALFFQFSPAEAKQYTQTSRRLYYFAKRIIEKKKPIKNLDWLENINVKYYQSLAPKLQTLVTKGTHKLFTSTKVLAKNFTALFGAAVENLPMPGPKYDIPKLTSELVEVSEKNYPPICIGYFGHSSLEKGGQFLEFLVRKTRVLYPNSRFVLHINPNKDTVPHFKYFDTNEDPNIECHYGHLTQEMILNLMQQVDIILIPYSAEKYATTPSAIFSESMPLKKIFVLPKNTWAHLEAQRYNAGYTVFEKYNALSILKAIMRAIINFRKLQQKSLVASKHFYEQNNITNYTNQFIQIVKAEEFYSGNKNSETTHHS